MDSVPPADQTTATRLSDAHRGQSGRIVGVSAQAVRGGVDPIELERRLLEAGFVEGARVTLLHEGPMGGDPIAIRLDDMRVALRRREAHGVLVQMDGAQGTVGS
jgi:ferrous iron transport protein A